MALKKVIELQGDCFLSTSYGRFKTGQDKIAITAYIKICNISGDKDKISVNVNFSDKNIEFNKRYEAPVSTDTDAPNFIKQAYEYLKTLPEFENSEDC
jgi:hypothetical protein